MKLTGRRLRIAQGKVPTISTQTVLRYRKRWEEQGYELPQLERKIWESNSQAGTHLKDVINEKLGHVKPCGGCNATLKKMNRMSVEEIRDNLDKLAEDILQRGARILPWTNPVKSLAKLFPGTAKQTIVDWITEAMDRANTIHWAVGINSSKRKKPTWEDTYTSLKGAGFDPIIFAEPTTQNISQLPSNSVVRPKTIADPLFSEEQIHESGVYGAHQNFVQTLSDLLRAFPEANTLIYAQDDAVFTKGTKEFLERILWPYRDCGLLSLWCPSGRDYPHPDPRIPKTPSPQIIGAVAWVMRREVAEYLVSHPDILNWRGVAASNRTREGHNRKALDAAVGEALFRSQWKVHYLTHSIADHREPVKGNSSVGNGAAEGFRRTHMYVGDEATGEQILNLYHYGHKIPEISTDPVFTIIPAVDNPELTISCIEHLASSTEKTTICYVDNGSTPENFQKILDVLPDSATIVRNETNLGFTKAIQQGIDEWKKGDQTGHVLLLNNDCRVSSTCIQNLKVVLEANSKVASTCPVTMDNGACSLKRVKNSHIAGLRKVPSESSPEVVQKLLTKDRIAVRNILPWFCCLLHKDALQELSQLPTDQNVASGLAVDDWWSKQLTNKGYRHMICYSAYADHDHSVTFRTTGQDRKSLQNKAKQWLRTH